MIHWKYGEQKSDIPGALPNQDRHGNLAKGVVFGLTNNNRHQKANERVHAALKELGLDESSSLIEHPNRQHEDPKVVFSKLL